MSHHSFLAVVVLSTAIDALAAATALLGVPIGARGVDRRQIDARRLLATAAIAGLVFVVKLVPLGLYGLNVFGMIHLVYVDLTVLLPSMSLVLLFAAARGAPGKPAVVLTRSAQAVSLTLLGLAPIGVYATWVEPFRLRLETSRITLPSRRDGTGELRIGVLADLQTDRVTSYEKGAVARLMALKPDIILLPGDLFQGSPAEFEGSRAALVDLLSGLSAPGGVFFVLGDFDGPGSPLDDVLRSAGVRLLVDEVVQVAVKGRLVTIGGVQLNVATPTAREVVDQLESRTGEGDIRILMAHRPDVALMLKTGSRIDLVVAGHTHGGQVVIPGFGPPVTLTDVPRRVAAGGLHGLSGNRVYVSRGVGCERGQAPRIRFLCPPEISLLELSD